MSDVSDIEPSRKRLRFQKSVPFLLAFAVAYLIIHGVAGAATKVFWFDELVTLSVNSQSSLKAVWAALSSAVDAQPMGFYVAERSASSLVANNHIALRLPAILAFPCTFLCIFFYLKKRSGEWVALISAVLLLSTVLFERYAIEARPYSLFVACIAFALICYQRLPSAFWTVMLGITLALSQTFHHYSVFAIVPFGLAESVFLFTNRSFRWKIWLALFAGAVPLLFFWPLLAHVREHFGAHLFEKYSFSAMPSTYGAYFLTDSGYGIAIAFTGIAGIITLFLWLRRQNPLPIQTNHESLAEGTLLVSLICLPAIVYTVVRVLHGGMRDGYALPAILGVCLAVGYVLARAKPLTVTLFAVFLFFNIGLREYKFWRSAYSFHLVKPTEGFEEFLRTSGYGNSDIPIVVANGMVYAPLAFYASAPLKSRLYYLTDEEKELQYQGTDTFDRNVKLLNLYLPLQIPDYSEFTAKHPTYFLYGEDPGYGNTWLAKYLSHEGYSVQAVAVDPNRRLFLVNMQKRFSHGNDIRAQ
jgi:hypothetical protein